MKYSILFFILLLSLSGCGVKAPPLAPQADPLPLQLNCSVDDPNCDRIDENYGK